MRMSVLLLSLAALAATSIPAAAGVTIRTPGGVYVDVNWGSGTVIVDVKKKRRATVKY